MHAIVRRFSNFIKWPDEEQLKNSSLQFKKWCKFDGAVGAIDGIIIPTMLPDNDLRMVMYCERKSTYGFNVQAACNENCQFTFLSVAHFASIHDGRALKETRLWSELDAGLLSRLGDDNSNFFLLGDNAYPLRRFLLHPWKGAHKPGTRADSFNFYLSAARCCIERAFGQTIMEFPILKAGLNLKNIEDTIATIQACFILHNIKKVWNEPLCTHSYPGTRDGLGTVTTEQQAMEYVRQLSEGATIGERLQSDRRLSAVNDAAAAKELRQDLAYWLNDHGFCRPDAELDFTTPCPDEDDEAAEGLT